MFVKVWDPNSGSELDYYISCTLFTQTKNVNLSFNLLNSVKQRLWQKC